MRVADGDLSAVGWSKWAEGKEYTTFHSILGTEL